MKRIIKVILFFWLLFDSSFVFAQTDLDTYLNDEQERIAKVDSIEIEISSFISNNFSNYSLTQSKIDEVTDNLLNEHDGSEDPITGEDLERVLLEIKKTELRDMYFNTYPEKVSLLDPIPLPEQLKQQCVNGGFEDGVANYSFRRDVVNPSNHMQGGCSVNPSNVYTPTGLNQFQNSATLVSPGNEPLLFSLGVSINRVRNGNRSLKLNPNPVTASADGQIGNATRVFRNFVINENQIDFSFLHIGSVVTTNTHGQPTFRYRLIDNITNAVLRNVCILMNINDCRYVRRPDTRAGWAGTTISYTPQWVCQRINTDDLIGRNVRLEFTVSDCAFRGHFSTVYIDDICGVTCPPTWGNINLNPLNLNCPTSPINVCGNFQLPANSNLTSMVLNVLNQSGSTVGTINNPTITGNGFCFTVNPTVFGANPIGNYTFQVVANTNSTCFISPLTDTTGVVSFNNCCQPTLTLQSPLDNMSNNSTNPISMRECSDWIRASNIINVGNANSGDGVVYHAGNFVELNPGFEAMFGSQFKAYPEGCTANYVYKTGDNVNDEEIIESEYENNSGNLIKNKIKLYPNPTNGLINVNYANSKFNQIKITSIEGRVVYDQKTELTNSYQLDISNFKNGIYTLSVVTIDGTIFTEKLIKN